MTNNKQIRKDKIQILKCLRFRSFNFKFIWNLVPPLRRDGYWDFSSQSGMGIVEIVIAIGLFLIIAASGTVVVVQSLRGNNLSDDQTKATFFANEGMEAIRSIKNRSWPLPTGTYGLSNSSGSWQLSGSSTVDGKFTRQMFITDVNRDTNGAIVASGGTIDSNTKRVRSVVTYTSLYNNANTLDFSQYYTNWKKTINPGGMLVYADYSGLDDVLKYKILTSSGNWTAEQTLPDIGVPLDRPLRNVKLYSSKTRNEKILITKYVLSGTGNDQYLYAQVWNGIAWGNVVQLSSWAGATNPDVRNFDGAYLNNGNFLLVYDDDTTTPQYTLWNGSSWTAGAATLNVGGNPEWIVVRNKPSTNEAMVAIYDASDDTNTMYWNGSTWGGLTEHATASTGSQYENVDFAWNPNTPSTGLLIFNEAKDNFLNFRIWNGSWGLGGENADTGAQTRAMQVVGRPGGNEFLACVKDAAADINCLKNDFARYWTTFSELATDTDNGSQRSFGVAYENASGSLALNVYSNGTTDTLKQIPKYRTYNPITTLWTAEASLGALGIDGTASLETVNLIPYPSSDDIMVLMGDSSQDLWTVVWNGTSNIFYSTGGKAQTKQSSNGSNDTDFWYDFAWDLL